jgi:hypothetical protein
MGGRGSASIGPGKDASFISSEGAFQSLFNHTHRKIRGGYGEVGGRYQGVSTLTQGSPVCSYQDVCGENS